MLSDVYSLLQAGPEAGASTMSDLRSALNAITINLTASNISDIVSQLNVLGVATAPNQTSILSSLSVLYDRLNTGLAAGPEPSVDDVVQEYDIIYHTYEAKQLAVQTVFDLSGRDLRVVIEDPLDFSNVEIISGADVSIAGDASEIAQFSPTDTYSDVRVLNWALWDVTSESQVLVKGQFDVQRVASKT